MKTYEFNRNDTDNPTDQRTIVETETFYKKDSSGNYVADSTKTRKLTVARLKEEYWEKLQTIVPAIEQTDEMADQLEQIKSDLGLTDTDVPALEKMSTKLTAEQKDLLGME